jgi:hypothetical protein
MSMAVTMSAERLLERDGRYCKAKRDYSTACQVNGLVKAGKVISVLVVRCPASPWSHRLAHCNLHQIPKQAGNDTR